MIAEKEVLKIKTTKELHKLTWQDFADRKITEKEFRHIFTLCDAFWIHDGNPAHPHAELTTGRCSNGYIDALRGLRFTNICQIMAHQSLKRIREVYDGPIDWVVGSDHAGATFSYAIASLLNAQHDFTEKGPDNTQIWKRFVIAPNETVLQAEDLMTMGATTRAVKKSIVENNPHPVKFVPHIYVLFHRSDVKEIDGTPIVYLFHFDIWTAEPKDCQLCASGSSRLRPKKHWTELTRPTAK